MIAVFFCHQPFLGSGEASNKLGGKIKLGAETLATIDGKWDQEVYIKHKSTGVGCYTHCVQQCGWLIYTLCTSNKKGVVCAKIDVQKNVSIEMLADFKQ